MPEILYGRNPVLEALRASRRLRRLLLAPGLGHDRRLGEILARARDAGVAVEETPRRRLDDVAHSEHHQGVAAYFDSRQLANRERLSHLALGGSPGWPPLLLCLDEVQDPQNLGSLARSAEALGVAALVLPRHRSAPLSAAVAKASAGAIEHLEVVRVSNLVQSLQELRDLGVAVVGLAAEGGAPCQHADLRGPLAVVAGAEGTGLRPLTRRTCDQLISVPMGGRADSLNVAVATAVVLYEVARQRAFRFPRGVPAGPPGRRLYSPAARRPPT